MPQSQAKQAAGVSRASAAPRAAFITALYADFLSRQPSADDVAFWSAKLAAGAPRSIIADGFANSDEYRTIRIEQAYQTVLGRDGEPAGIANWLEAMHRGAVTNDDIEKALFESDEFYLRAAARYGMNPNDGSFLDTLYATILGREAMGGEGGFWLTASYAQMMSQNWMHPDLNSTRPWLTDQIYGSTEAARRRVTTIYDRFLARFPDESGLQLWAAADLSRGDSAVRAGFTASDEYYQRASARFA
ncbi:DUF4214 domain-containing protein [Subtercola boreus]|uniref:DUF4214 domain-containing protein n=1 Tax=Subtercola boreus TaxID=120213 RepID=UPI00116861F1|nr:DUF4214 domain-containing protein [Subtercola boreus]TQL52533.1 uncharacterized protein DUF4214 [Subtercola boreus]